MFLSLGFLLSKSSLRDPSSISILYAGVREPLRFHLTYDVSFIRRLCPDSNQISGNRRLAVINEVTVDISECFIVIDRFDLTEVNILIPNIHKALAEYKIVHTSEIIGAYLSLYQPEASQ